MFKRASQKDCAESLAKFETEALPHLDKLFRCAVWLVRDCAKAERLVQETLAQALGEFHQYDGNTNCHVWLMRIMYAVKSKRQQQRSWSMWHKRGVAVSSEAQISETVAFELPTPSDLTEAEVLRALESLTPQFQEILMLSDAQNLTYKEIAEVLSIPVSIVMLRLTRARKMLRTGLAADANRRNTGCARVDGSTSKPHFS